MNRLRVAAVKVREFCDWRFWLCLTAAVAAFGIVFALVFFAIDNQEKGHRIDVLIAEGKVERQEASAERRELLRGQHDLQRKYDGLLAQQKALLVWLRTHGIVVPADLIASENADSSTVHSDGPRGSSKSGTTGTAAKSGSTAGSGSGSKSGGGKSSGGSAKGHGSKGGHSHGGGSGKGSGHSKAGHSKGHRSK